MKIVLQTQNLIKKYGSLTAVDQLSLEVYEGEVLGFLGPNGAGKTTSINMMCGLLKPDQGQVLLQGVLLDSSNRQARALVGMCPQHIAVWERLTCIEQLQFIGRMYGLNPKTARRRSEYLLDVLGLIEKRKKQARTLSGGMQRRLNLALALVHDPEIIVLDEPEAGLDPQSRLKVREYIQSIARAKTVILTTHNMDEAERMADRVAIIDHGQLLELDTPEALKKRMGEGDVLEIRLNGGEASAASIQEAADAMKHLGQINISTDVFTLRALNAVNLLPVVLEKLAQLGMEPGEVRLRQNTLEDVFIHLTGRRLRQ